MQNEAKNPARNGTVVAFFVFIGIVAVILLIALLNAPTMGGPRVMATLQTYLTEVRETAIPYMVVVGMVAIIVAFFAARELRKVWTNHRRRTEFVQRLRYFYPS